MTIDREQLVDRLHQGEVVVDFLKKDGTLRRMRATLAAAALPPQPEPQIREAAPPEGQRDQDLITVWDLERSGWRSFRVSRVVGVAG